MHVSFDRPFHHYAGAHGRHGLAPRLTRPFHWNAMGWSGVPEPPAVRGKEGVDGAGGHTCSRAGGGEGGWVTRSV